jgi:hypothetical protein
MKSEKKALLKEALLNSELKDRLTAKQKEQKLVPLPQHIFHSICRNPDSAFISIGIEKPKVTCPT